MSQLGAVHTRFIILEGFPSRTLVGRTMFVVGEGFTSSLIEIV